MACGPDVERALNLNHCANRTGNAWCAELFPDGSRPYCEWGTVSQCGGTEDRTGCVAQRPEADECYSPCGGGLRVDEDASCVDADESSSGTSTGMETEGSSDASSSGSSTTGPMPCTSDEECTEPEAPFCGTAGECGTCDQTADGDAACGGVDEALPLCVGQACVACTAEDASVCEPDGLVCDDMNTCVPCTEHEQCTVGACELSVGRCFPSDSVQVAVDGDGGQDQTSLVAALGMVPDGGYGVVTVHETDGLGYPQVIVNGAKTIALLAAPGEAPIIQGTGGSPGVRVEAAGTILYMDGLRVAGNTGGLGVVVDEAFAWLDRSRIVQNSGGGLMASNGAELTVRNCFVSVSTNSTDAVVVTDATMNMSYTTVGAAANTGMPARALYCDVGGLANVRNSILVSFEPGPDIECPGLTISNSATETELGMLSGTWFEDYNSGDLHLTPMAPIAIAMTALWETGDPATDIDGEPRPTIDGEPDYAGADVP
ncbi:MAG: hypothetical protein AB1Z98_08055 [Nannocystaceae bacterium]